MPMDDSPKLLVWNYTEEEKTALDAFLKEVGSPEAYPIARDQGYLLVKDILHTDKRAGREFECDEKVILFYNFPPKGISFLLDQSKSRKLPRPIYAVVTEHSINWPFNELVEHLLEERKEFEHLQQSTS